MQVGGDKRKRVAGAIKEEEDFEEEGEEKYDAWISNLTEFIVSIFNMN